MGHSRAVPTQASTSYSPLWLPCCPQHLGVLCRHHHGAVHQFQARCKSRAASSAQEQIAVLFMRTYAGPAYSQGFDLSLASVRIRKSGLVQWHSSSSADGQQGRGDCWLFPLGRWLYIPSEEVKNICGNWCFEKNKYKNKI